MSQPSSVSMGMGPAPILVDCQADSSPFTVLITCRWQPQNFMSGLWLTKMSPKGVCPVSLGRESIIYMPPIFRGNSTPLRL